MKNYFQRWEVECKCGCGECDMSQIFMDTLNQARYLSDIPYSLNSAFRCPTHNLNEGGGEDSAHLTGQAADIKTPNSHIRFLVLDGLIFAGFKRIGIHRLFIHADSDLTKPPEVSWLY